MKPHSFFLFFCGKLPCIRAIMLPGPWRRLFRWICRHFLGIPQQKQQQQKRTQETRAGWRGQVRLIGDALAVTERKILVRCGAGQVRPRTNCDSCSFCYYLDMDLAQFEGLVSNLMSGDNSIRQTSEVFYQQILQQEPDKIVVLLLQLGRASARHEVSFAILFSSRVDRP